VTESAPVYQGAPFEQPNRVVVHEIGGATVYFVADPDDKTVLARNVGDIVGAILDDDLRIIGYDGQPTAWGKYFPTYVRDFEHMNALLLLQHVKVAHHVTEDERFAREYRRLAYDMGYADIAVTARAMGDPTRRGAVNHSDDVLLFLAYYPLLRYETDPDLRAKYLASLRRTWEGDGSLPGVKPEANPLYAFLANAFLNDDSGTAAGIQTLRWFPFDMKWNRDTIAQYQTQFGFAFDPRPVSPALGPGQPIPLDRRQKTWSAWVADPYAEAGDRTADSLVVYNGHDYLIAYWLGRYHSLIGPEL